MFHVPRYAGGHPRLVLVLIFGGLLMLAGAVGWWSAKTPMHDAALAASRRGELAPRPPLVVVEDLPQLTERLNREAAAGRFMARLSVQNRTFSCFGALALGCTGRLYSNLAGPAAKHVGTAPRQSPAEWRFDHVAMAS